MSSVTVAGLVPVSSTPAFSVLLSLRTREVLKAYEKNYAFVVPFGAVGESQGQLPRIPLRIHCLLESTVVFEQIVVDVALVLLSRHHH